MLCVPDAEIAQAAAAVAGAAPLVGHTSGATPLSALEAARAGSFGLHPLQTFAPGSSGLTAFAGAGCAVAGTTPAALAFAAALARALGMTPFEIDDEGRAAYHAAASVASNFLVTLHAAAERIAAGAGLEPADARALLLPLVRRTRRERRGARAGGERSPDRSPAATTPRSTPSAAPSRRPRPSCSALFDELVRHTRAAGQRCRREDGPHGRGAA